MSAAAAASDKEHRIRSSTFGSLQTLTRALRESLRLRRLRKQKRLRNEANAEQMRRRSKSVGNAIVDDDISDIGISVVMASDIGPIVNPTRMPMQMKPKQLTHRRQSKSVDDVELAEIKRNVEREREAASSKLSPRMNANNNGHNVRRRSKDDHDLPNNTNKEKSSNYYASEQKGFRKRFGRLFGSLRTKQSSHTQLQPETPSPSSASSNEFDDNQTPTTVTVATVKTTAAGNDSGGGSGSSGTTVVANDGDRDVVSKVNENDNSGKAVVETVNNDKNNSMTNNTNNDKDNDIVSVDIEN
ncbi:putative uncharacterized protein DDB_G0287457 [Oppia nitens]|uniref:putative uncharacterized protein DDB_G0287457 n=1 Tax=Oppia nitens TaxID=1686743 RepID=UPI0023D9F769|nr:putative uncharacterized protein DDB_G0287457 [Oppia nitens]